MLAEESAELTHIGHGRQGAAWFAALDDRFLLPYETTGNEREHVMFRPLFADLLTLLVPVGVGLLAFIGGWFFRRWPRWLQIACLGVAAAVVTGGAVALVGPLPDDMSALVSLAGGSTVLLCWAALLMVGIAWAAPNRRFSTGFLACLAAVAGGLLFIEGSGPLWWRFGAPELDFNVPDSQGRLRQSSGLTCSPAAAAMLLHRYGVRASEGEMAYLAGTSLFGSDAPAMSRALNEKIRPNGWKAYAGHADYDQCLRRGVPFVAHVQRADLGHAVLVEQVSPDGVRIIDPIEGESKTLSRAGFELVWDGTVIWIDRRAELAP
jgi:hypothetical protein